MHPHLPRPAVRNAFPLLFTALTLTVLGGSMGQTTALMAQQSPVRQAPGIEPQIAFLFAYTMKDGMRSHFDEGYRRHLDWHADRQDSLAWYAWDVLTGDRVGLFIDGTFGAPFGAMDARVDPAGDGADFESTAGAFAVPAFREIYRLRADLSSATPLEDRAPTPLVQAVTYEIRAGAQAGFESVVERLATATDAPGASPLFTTYERVDGAGIPGYLILFSTERYADLGSRPAGLGAMARRGLPAREIPDALGILDRAVTGTHSEIWRYRADLSLIPERR